MARNVEQAFDRCGREIADLERKLNQAEGRLSNTDDDYERGIISADITNLNRRLSRLYVEWDDLENRL